LPKQNPSQVTNKKNVKRENEYANSCKVWQYQNLKNWVKGWQCAGKREYTRAKSNPVSDTAKLVLHHTLQKNVLVCKKGIRVEEMELFCVVIG